MPERYQGGNSRASGQSLLISRDVEALKSYQRAMSTPNPIPEDMLDAWARRMVELEPWIEARAKEAGARYLHGTGWSDRGVVLEFPEYGAAEAVAHSATILPVPSGVWLTFKANVERRQRIRRQFETRVVDLVQDPDTLEVFGAVVEQGGARRCIRARRGLVMCTGGFENNLDMQRNYFGLAEAHPLGTPGNTGDGIKILQKAGADMWHLRNQGQSGGIWPGFRFPGHDTVFLRQLFWQTFSWIDIGRDHRRFFDETWEWQLTHYKQRVHGEWIDTPHHRVGKMHMIFDETTRAATTPPARRASTRSSAAAARRSTRSTRRRSTPSRSSPRSSAPAAARGATSSPRCWTTTASRSRGSTRRASSARCSPTCTRTARTSPRP